jgi:hypothetical protein
MPPSPRAERRARRSRPGWRSAARAWLGVLAAAAVLTTGCESGSRDWSEGRPAEQAGFAGGPPLELAARSSSTRSRAASDRAPAPSQQVREAQHLLRAKGFDPGAVDGVAGQRTREAVMRFQRERGLPATGRVSPALLAELRKGARDSQRTPSPPPDGARDRSPPPGPLTSEPAPPRPADISPQGRLPQATSPPPASPKPAPVRPSAPSVAPTEPVLPPSGMPRTQIPSTQNPPAEAPPRAGEAGGLGRLPRQSDPE